MMHLPAELVEHAVIYLWLSKYDKSAGRNNKIFIKKQCHDTVLEGAEKASRGSPRFIYKVGNLSVNRRHTVAS